MVDKDEIHRVAISENVWERIDAANQISLYFVDLTDKEQAKDDLHLLIYDTNSYVRWSAAKSIGAIFPLIPDNKRFWIDLIHFIHKESVFTRKTIAESLGVAFLQIHDKNQTWGDLHRLTQNKNGYVRWEMVLLLYVIFPYVPDKKHAWEDLHRLAQDEDSYVRRGAALTLGAAFPYIPDKNQAWNDLHCLTLDESSGVRRSAVYALSLAFLHIPDTNRAWIDLIRLMLDENKGVRWQAAYVIGIIFRFIPHKNQAWEDLHKLLLDNDKSVQWNVAYVFAIINNIPERNKLFKNLRQLTQEKETFVKRREEYALSVNYPNLHETDQPTGIGYDGSWINLLKYAHVQDWYVRQSVAYSLGEAFPHIPDKNQAWSNLHQLTQDKDLRVRQGAAYSLDRAFPHIPDKSQAWNDLLRLTQDRYSDVRQNATYSLSKAFLYMLNKNQVWDDLYRLTHDKDRDVQHGAIYALVKVFPYMPDKNQFWKDLHQLIRSRDWHVRQGAGYTLGIAFSQLPNKSQAWDDLIFLAQDKKSILKWRTIYALKVAYLREKINQDEIHRKTLSNEVEERKEALYLLNNCFVYLHDKKQAWEDIRRLMHDECIGIRESAVCALGIIFPYSYDKKQAWEDLFQVTEAKEIVLRHHAINAMSTMFNHISQLKQAWEDLQNLTLNDDGYIRDCAAESLGAAFSRISNEDRWWALEILVSVFPYIPDKRQAYEGLIQMIQDNSSSVRLRAVYALFTIFPQIPDKEQVWKDLMQLTQDEDSEVRSRAASALVSTFTHILDKEQAWYDLQRLMHHWDSEVRSQVASALGFIFHQIPDREKAWNDLIYLTQDKNCNVRVSANYSLGRASLLKATDANSKEIFKRELERALEFFEKSSKESPYFNPSSFCLPFYRSFYLLTFERQDLELEIQKYLDEANAAVRGSDCKEKLLQAVENLANALKEVQNARHFNEMKCDLKVYSRYLENAANLLASTEKKAPWATKMIRKGLPIIDEKIKKIVAEMQSKAISIYNGTKDTSLEEIALRNCKIAQDLSLQDPLALGVGLSRLIDTAKGLCEYIKQKDKRRFAYEKISNVESMDILAQPYVFVEVFDFISKNLDIPRVQTVHISEVQKETIRVATVQFCYKLTKSFPPVIENNEAIKLKIFSGLDIAKQDYADIVCLPELCLCEEWILEIENKYPDMIVIGGGFYKDSKNVCPVMIKSSGDVPLQSKITPSAFEDSEMWGTGMMSGDRIYKYETQFGKFVILICRDFENLVHYFRDTDIDFIFCPAFNDANDRFHQEANNHVTKTPSYIVIANNGVYGGTSIFAQLNRNYFDRLVGEGCKDEEDLSYKLCEIKKGKDEVIIADFNITHKAIQVPTPSEPSKEKRSVTHIKKVPIP